MMAVSSSIHSTALSIEHPCIPRPGKPSARGRIDRKQTPSIMCLSPGTLAHLLGTLSGIQHAAYFYTKTVPGVQ